jgi:DNA-directed RNA polymerase subunit K/omega
MVKRPDGMNAFEFAVLSGLRAAQLQRGCTPRVSPSEKVTVTAQHELAERKVVRAEEAGVPTLNLSSDEEVNAARSSG